jgi:signal transduction histidine kinase
VRRRLFVFLASIFLLVVVAGAIVNHAGGDWKPGSGEDGPPEGFWWPPLALLLIGSLIFIIARKISRTFAPLEGVMDAAGRVAEGDYSVRVAPGGPPDVQGVVAAFNIMTERLATSEIQRKHLLSDIAHELRTPLAVVHGTIEGMLDDVYPRDSEHLAPLLDRTRAISRLLDDLQTVATAEAGMLALHRSESDLADLVREVAASWWPIAARQGVTMTTTAPPSLVLQLDAGRIRQVLDNLVTNAVRYTPEGGSISLELHAVAEGAEVVVRDTGRGMSADDASRMFERFVKSADSGGSGLGLAIARSLVEAHGGTIAATSQPGRGTTITITLLDAT